MLFFLWVPDRASASEDPWFSKDKGLHFGISAALAAGGYGLTVPFDDREVVRAGVGAAFSLSIGISKELYDLHRGGALSYRDLVWDFLGTATGVLIAWLIDQALNRRPVDISTADSG